MSPFYPLFILSVIFHRLWSWNWLEFKRVHHPYLLLGVLLVANINSRGRYRTNFFKFQACHQVDIHPTQITEATRPLRIADPTIPTPPGATLLHLIPRPKDPGGRPINMDLRLQMVGLHPRARPTIGKATMDRGRVTPRLLLPARRLRPRPLLRHLLDLPVLLLLKLDPRVVHLPIRILMGNSRHITISIR